MHKPVKKLKEMSVLLMMTLCLAGCGAHGRGLGNPGKDEVVAKVIGGCDWVEFLGIPDAALNALDAATEGKREIRRFKERVEVQDSNWLDNCPI